MAEPTPAFPNPDADNAVRVVPERATGRAFHEQLWFPAVRSFRRLKKAAYAALASAKDMTAGLAEERPVQLVVGVTIAAFIAGAGLRIWRNYHE